jgi:hypothetical protein
MTAHAAWEDSLLFPAITGTLSEDDMGELKGLKKRQERDLLGRDATSNLYRQLTGLELACGVTGPDIFTRHL